MWTFRAAAIALVGLLAVPGLQAHLDPGARVVPGASLGLDGQGAPDPHVEATDPVQGNGLDRVAGWYYGSANLAFADEQVALASLCDMEVVDGGAADEQTVDGSPGGQLPDGTFNDGGTGAACHFDWEGLRPTSFGCEQYSDPASPSFGNAQAEDAVLGGRVWIATACDFVTSHGDPCGPGGAAGCNAIAMANCAINAVVAGPDGITDCARDSCLADDPAACIEEGVVVEFCGADGRIDAMEFGEGGGHAGPGVPFPSTPPEWSVCAPQGLAFVFVFSAVLAAPEGAGQASVATSGWIR